VKKLDAELARFPQFESIRKNLAACVQAVSDCVDYIVANAGKDVKGVFAGAVPFLRLMGIVAGGWQLARAALACEKLLSSRKGEESFLKAKIITAQFFAEQVLVQAPALRDTVLKGGNGVMALSEEQFLAA